MTEKRDTRDTAIDRRRLLTRGALAVGAAALWTPATGLAQLGRSGEGRGHGWLKLDVACLGYTFAPNLGSALDPPADLRGVTFNVEGRIYEAGTIPAGDGFDPDSAEAIGTWLCRGFFLLNAERELPHVSTIQEYLLPSLASDPTPRHGLVSSGVEGGVPRVDRAIIGGIGRYANARARGEVEQLTIGTNITILNEFDMPAPNFRFTFRRHRGGG